MGGIDEIVPQRPNHRIITSNYYASRLQPCDVGPVTPVASNLTEEGRSKNRRVELVEQ